MAAQAAGSDIATAIPTAPAGMAQLPARTSASQRTATGAAAAVSLLVEHKAGWLGAALLKSQASLVTRPFFTRYVPGESIT